jgi:5-methylcytosine-specific restriction endonuclease McrA
VSSNEDLVLSRDGYCCSYCGTTLNLHIHHISYRSHHGKETKDFLESIENKIVLCEKCHELVHAKKLIILYSKSLNRPVVVTKFRYNSKFKNNKSLEVIT